MKAFVYLALIGQLATSALAATPIAVFHGFGDEVRTSTLILLVQLPGYVGLY